MDAGHENLDLEGRDVDTYPLLMDHNSNNEHVVDVRPGFSAAGVGDSEHSTLNHISTSQMSIQDHDMGTLGRSQNGVSAASTSSSSRSNRAGTSYNLSRQRLSPLNSGLWISIEFTITVSQIVASIIVLSLSRDEKPQAPLNVWVAGYAAGCLATLPLLYWRYMHRHGSRNREQEPSSQSTPSPSSPPASPRNNSYVALSMPAVPQGEENHDTSSSRDTDNQDSRSDNSRFTRIVEKFKIALDCYFAVWFVVGNVWIFGGHSSSSEAPNLYRLCIVFLTFSCIGYAMPFILCATICCCLPCIIAVLGFHEEQTNGRGASAETIGALPTYKFKARVLKEKKVEKDESDGESSNDGGFVAAGTEKERVVSGEDAVCCICLAKYTDEVELRELPCTHHFHVECVDKWLKINASCPLCKHDIGGSTDQNMAGIDVAEDQRSEQSH